MASSVPNINPDSLSEEDTKLSLDLQLESDLSVVIYNDAGNVGEDVIDGGIAASHDSRMSDQPILHRVSNCLQDECSERDLRRDNGTLPEDHTCDITSCCHPSQLAREHGENISDLDGFGEVVCNGCEEIFLEQVSTIMTTDLDSLKIVRDDSDPPEARNSSDNEACTNVFMDIRNDEVSLVEIQESPSGSDVLRSESECASESEISGSNSCVYGAKCLSDDNRCSEVDVQKLSGHDEHSGVVVPDPPKALCISETVLSSIVVDDVDPHVICETETDSSHEVVRVNGDHVCDVHFLEQLEIATADPLSIDIGLSEDIQLINPKAPTEIGSFSEDIPEGDSDHKELVEHEFRLEQVPCSDLPTQTSFPSFSVPGETTVITADFTDCCGQSSAVKDLLYSSGLEHAIYDVPPRIRFLSDPITSNELTLTQRMLSSSGSNLLHGYHVKTVDDGGITALHLADNDGIPSSQVMPEENIYEELNHDFIGKFTDSGTDSSEEKEEAPQLFGRRGLVGEVFDEVQQVERQHVQVLEALNLDMENMIMPISPATSPSSIACMHAQGYASTLPVILPSASSTSTVTSTPFHEVSTSSVTPPLLPHCTSPMPITTPAWRPPYKRSSIKSESKQSTSPTLKRWLTKLPSLASFREKRNSINSNDDVRRHSFNQEPIYMLYDDTYRHQPIDAGPNDAGADEDIYEDIDVLDIAERPVSGKVPDPELQSQDAEIFESYNDPSDSESEKSVQSTGSKLGLAGDSIKNKLRSVKLNFSRRRTGSDGDDKQKKKKKKEVDVSKENDGKFLRLFGWKKEYDLDRTKVKARMPQVPEEDETLVGMRILNQNLPLSLPPTPPGLSAEQLKRRYIVGTLIHSENSYLASLGRLIHDYKKPLEESSPPILSSTKIDILFHRLEDIHACHCKFRGTMSSVLRRWDREERIGDAFVTSFSSPEVLNIYSDFINNFSTAMEMAKQEAKRKSALADFLKVQQITSQDRLSFFGLMVKPVQRFPQFILLLQDLLKHTVPGHQDRMSLQMALTQLESLAETLNERKRASEQHHAMKEVLRHVRSTAKTLTVGTRYLLRQDSMSQLEFSMSGQLVKSKHRRLFLLNDLLVCVAVSQRASDNANGSARFSPKWAVPISDVEVQDEVSPTVTRMLAAMGAERHSGRPDKAISESDDGSGFHHLCHDIGDLLHDFEVIGRVTALVSSLRRSYEGLSIELLHSVSQFIQHEVQRKDQEMQWIDSCCLQLAIISRSKTGKELQRDLYVYQTGNASVKQEWMTDLRLAQRAIDINNSPAWIVSEDERRPATKLPLFIRSMPILSANDPTEVKCGCFYRISSNRPLSVRSQDYVWLCASDGVNSYIRICCLRHSNLRDINVVELHELRVSAMEAVPSVADLEESAPLECTVWMGSDSRKVLVYRGSDPDHPSEVGVASVGASVLQIRYHNGLVFVALSNGTIAVFHPGKDGCWQLKDPYVVTLGSDPVTCLLPVDSLLYCGCGRRVWVLNTRSLQATRSYVVQHEHMGSVYAIAHSGVGLWVNLRNTGTVCLYHTETFQHLQDIDVAPLVRVILCDRDHNALRNPRRVFVTALLACRGLLWVGTNVGVTLTLSLPRLEGIPIVTGRANISCHRLAGPVTLLMALMPRSNKTLKASLSSSSSSSSTSSYSPPTTTVTERRDVDRHARLGKQLSDGSLPSPALASTPIGKQQQASSPSLLQQPLSESKLRDLLRTSTTLPRPARATPRNVSGISARHFDDVYGLYGNLLNVADSVEDPVTPLDDDLRRSDPDLLPNLVSTLDRRLRLKSCRPRSLDLTNILSNTEPMYISSGSENGSSCLSISDTSGGSTTQSSSSYMSSERGIGTVKDVQTMTEVSTSSAEDAATHYSSPNAPKLFQAAPRQKMSAPIVPAPQTVLTLIGGR